ncbi:MAG: ribosome-associated translation inhibitor RaiA [Candidatus Paceibacterota bacterium]
MSFPTVNFKKTNADVADTLLDLAEEKLQTLEKFIGEAPTLCEAEFEKVSNQQSGPVHRFEVNLEVNGKLYRAEATAENFEQAIDEVRNELDKELRRARDKKDTLIRRGGRKIKQMLRFGR